MDTSQIPELLDAVMRLQERGKYAPVCLVGRSGMAKTGAVHAYADEKGLGCAVLRPGQAESAGDLLGSPYTVLCRGCPECPEAGLFAEAELEDHVQEHEEPEGVLAAALHGDAVRQQRFSLPHVFPRTGRGILFVDEVNRTPPDLQNAMLELLGERRLSLAGYELPPGWVVVAAMNPPTREYSATQHMDEALRGRLVFFKLVPKTAHWVEWARGAGLCEDVVSFFEQHSGFLGCEDFDEPVTKDLRGNLRLVQLLANLAECLDGDLLAEAAAGAIGQHGAATLAEYLRSRRVAVPAKAVLEDYASVKDRVTALRDEERSDVLHATANGILDLLRETERLGDDAVENLHGFLKDIPVDQSARVLRAMNQERGTLQEHFFRIEETAQGFARTARLATGIEA